MKVWTNKFFVFYWLLTILIVLLTVVETVKYPGVTYRYTHVKIEWLITAYLFLLSAINTSFVSKKIIVFTSSLLFAFFVFLVFLESINFSNYIFSTFHIHLSGVLLILCLSLSQFLPILFKEKSVWDKAALALLGWWTVTNMLGTVSYFGSKMRPILKNPRLSYDDKMRATWGRFYDCMLVVKKHTPENAIIFIPPQSGYWQEEGNEYLVRYFLYPRGIVHIESIEDATKSSGTKFVLYSKGMWGFPGEEDLGWPEATTSAKSGKFIDVNENFETKDGKRFNGNYMNNPNTCGIISI